MEDSGKLLLSCFFACILLSVVNGENPYRYITWKVTYGDIYPLGVKQQVHFFPLFSGFWFKRRSFPAIKSKMPHLFLSYWALFLVSSNSKQLVSHSTRVGLFTLRNGLKYGAMCCRGS